MPLWNIPITRDITETATITVEADTIHEAVAEALAKTETANFILDDDCRANSEPYFGDDFQSDPSEFLA